MLLLAALVTVLLLVNTPRQKSHGITESSRWEAPALKIKRTRFSWNTTQLLFCCSAAASQSFHFMVWLPPTLQNQV